jgi:hypothetical protein
MSRVSAALPDDGRMTVPVESPPPRKSRTAGVLSASANAERLVLEKHPELLRRVMGVQVVGIL